MFDEKSKWEEEAKEIENENENENENKNEIKIVEIKRLGMCNDQDEYKMQMKDWRGRSHSTSDFVSHFIASGNSQ